MGYYEATDLMHLLNETNEPKSSQLLMCKNIGSFFGLRAMGAL